MVGEYEEFSLSLGGLLCETAVALLSPEERDQLGAKPAHTQDRLKEARGASTGSWSEHA